MYGKQTNEPDRKIEIIHTIPKLDDTDREKNKKAAGNELYDIFLRIQTRFQAEND